MMKSEYAEPKKFDFFWFSILIFTNQVNKLRFLCKMSTCIVRRLW